MFSKKMLLSLFVTLTFVAAGSVNAAFTQLTGTNWEYETNAGATFTLNGGGGASTTDPWLVTETYTYSNNNTPITTHWRQTTAPTASGDNFFGFSEDLVNNSGTDWCSYSWVITDDNGTPQAGGSHPLAAHLHTGPLIQYSPFTTKTSSGNGVFSMSVNNGIVTDGSVWYASQVKAHDYDNYTASGETTSSKGGTPGNTAFTIVETPVACPEPATVATLGLAFFGIAALRRRAR